MKLDACFAQPTPDAHRSAGCRLGRLVAMTALAALLPGVLSCGSKEDAGGACASTTDVCRFNGSYGGTVSLSCPGLPLATAGFSLSISGGVIAVTSPVSGGGNVASNGDAAMTVTNVSDISGHTTMTGTFTVNGVGVASGGGTWSEYHSDMTCHGTWAVTRQ
jgi:hypothetical protein